MRERPRVYPLKCLSNDWVLVIIALTDSLSTRHSRASINVRVFRIAPLDTLRQSLSFWTGNHTFRSENLMISSTSTAITSHHIDLLLHVLETYDLFQLFHFRTCTPIMFRVRKIPYVLLMFCSWCSCSWCSCSWCWIPVQGFSRSHKIILTNLFILFLWLWSQISLSEQEQEQSQIKHITSDQWLMEGRECLVDNESINAEVTRAQLLLEHFERYSPLYLYLSFWILYHDVYSFVDTFHLTAVCDRIKEISDSGDMALEESGQHVNCEVTNVDLFISHFSYITTIHAKLKDRSSK